MIETHYTAAFWVARQALLSELLADFHTLTCVTFLDLQYDDYNIVEINRMLKKCLQFLITRSSKLVWTPNPSDRTRKGPGNNLARKCLAGMPRLFSELQRDWSGTTPISKFLRSTIYSLPVIELEHRLAEMRSFPHQHRRWHSNTQDTSRQSYPPDLPRAARRVWGPD